MSDKNCRHFKRDMSPSWILKMRVAGFSRQWYSWTFQKTAVFRVVQISQKSRSHLPIQGTRRVTWSNFSTEDSQTLRATAQNSVARATWPPEFLCTPGNNYGNEGDNRKCREMGLKLLNLYADCYNCLYACRVTIGHHTCVFPSFLLCIISTW